MRSGRKTPSFFCVPLNITEIQEKYKANILFQKTFKDNNQANI